MMSQNATLQQKTRVKRTNSSKKLPEHKEADKQRDAAVATWRISVLRYSNDNIRNNFNDVAEDILKHLELDYSDLMPVR